MGTKRPRYRIENAGGRWVIKMGRFGRKVWHGIAFADCPTELLHELNGPGRADIIAQIEERLLKLPNDFSGFPKKPRQRRGSRK